MAALPPDGGEAERELGEPHEREAEHAEQHSGADSPCGRLAYEAPSPPGIHVEHPDQHNEREQPVDAQEALVVSCLFEIALAEIACRIGLVETQVVGDLGRPEQIGGDNPDRNQDGAGQDPLQVPAQVPCCQAGGAGGGGGGGVSVSCQPAEGPLYG